MPAARSSTEELHTRRATLALNSFNSETRTFSAIAATDKPMLIPNFFDGDVYEVLSMRPGAVRMGRMQSGRSPILDGHRRDSNDANIGVITRAEVRAGQLLVDGKLTQADLASSFAQRIADGVAVNLSVGYRRYRTERSKDKSGIPLDTITDWEPVEVSIVPVGLDPETYIRSDKGGIMPKAARRTVQHAPRVNPDLPIEDDLDDANETRGIDATPNEEEDDPPPRRMSDRSARQAYEIAASMRSANIDTAWARSAIDRSTSLADFRGLLLTELAAQSARQPGQRAQHTRYGGGGGGDETFDNPNFVGTAIRDALLERLTGKRSNGRASQYRGMNFLQLGAECVSLRGERPDWSSTDNLLEQMFRRSSGGHSTSDFAAIVANVTNKRLMDGYQAAVGPWLQLSQERPASDFKPISNVRLSEHPKLQEVKEGAEIKYVTLSDGKETYAVKTYAGIIALTRQLLINDDLSAFDRMALLEGQAAAETVNSLFVAAFNANSGNGASLADGNPLYATSRGNKAASGTVIDETSLGLARKAMRETKGLDGKTPIGNAPKHLVVGPAKETEAEKMLAAISPVESSGANPFAGKLTLHVEPSFSGNAWRLFADPAQLPVLNHSYLSGQEGPQTSTREGWEVLGMEFRVVLDFGVGLIDWRGTYLNPGN